MFNRKLKDKIHVLEVIVDALIGVLVTNRTLSREDIQKHIINTAAEDTAATRPEDG